MRIEGAASLPASVARAVTAWSIWSAIIVLAMVGLVVRLINLDGLLDLLSGPHWWAEVVWWNVLVPLGILAFATVGALIVSRDSSNRLGWLLLLLAALATIHELAWQYAVRSIHFTAGNSPLEWLAVWLSHVVTPSVLVLGVAIVVLHFPDGRLVSARWRPLLAMTIAIAGFNVVSGTVLTVSGATVELTRPSALTVYSSSHPAGLINVVVEHLIAGVMILTGISIVVRWRSSSGIDRERLKWIAYVGALIGISLISSVLAVTLTGDSYISFAVLSLSLGWFTVGIPIATGIAILRYQLFDIDLVINRTLVYSVVMLGLVVVYGVGVVVLQSLLGSFAGSSTVAVAASTLGAIALFQPLRTRVQTWVDRRFYRTRHDRAQTLGQFAYLTRDEVDLERLQFMVCGLITETMQPRCITIWLADSGRHLSREHRTDHAG